MTRELPDAKWNKSVALTSIEKNVVGASRANDRLHRLIWRLIGWDEEPEGMIR